LAFYVVTIIKIRQSGLDKFNVWSCWIYYYWL
jgi:hypothetical protein